MSHHWIGVHFTHSGAQGPGVPGLINMDDIYTVEEYSGMTKIWYRSVNERTRYIKESVEDVVNLMQKAFAHIDQRWEIPVCPSPRNESAENYLEVLSGRRPQLQAAGQVDSW